MLPDLVLKKVTIKRNKNVYLLEVKNNPCYRITLEEISWLLLIREELDKQVCDYLYVLRNGSPVNAAIVIACGEGIVKSKGENFLAANIKVRTEEDRMGED